jgi:hypothetical protein
MLLITGNADPEAARSDLPDVPVLRKPFDREQLAKRVAELLAAWARICTVQRWLPFLDTYRTMCLAPQPDFRRLLEGIREMKLAGASQAGRVMSFSGWDWQGRFASAPPAPSALIKPSPNGAATTDCLESSLIGVAGVKLLFSLVGLVGRLWV